jgi:AcrR family transcriptional regulator
VSSTDVGASPATEDRIIEAAIQHFFDHGYDATGQRAIAETAGITTATLYYHFENKEVLLAQLMHHTMRELIDVVTTALSSTKDRQRALAAITRAHIEFHVAHVREVFICETELRGLGPESRSDLIALRDAYEQIFVSVIDDGIAEGWFDAPDPRIFTKSLLASCRGIAFWFRPTGPQSLEDISQIYIEAFERALSPETRSVIARRR